MRILENLHDFLEKFYGNWGKFLFEFWKIFVGNFENFCENYGKIVWEFWEILVGF